jgi:hypothetical protein
MNIYKYLTALMVLFVMTYGGVALAAVSPQEAAQLGTTLTKFGSEKAGNADGTIPSYTGGLTTLPAGFDAVKGIRPDPFAGEKPFLSITPQNMQSYLDKLTEGTKALMKRYPTFRIDVYKTHRTVFYPDWVLNNTMKLATTAQTADEGTALTNAHAGFPFPIPKTGQEVIWNHNLHYQGLAHDVLIDAYVVDRAGRLTETGQGNIWIDWIYWDTKSRESAMWMEMVEFTNPARFVGQWMLLHEPVNPGEHRKAWQYLPGQRRVKLAPEISFDTPNTALAGIQTYDDNYLFNGSTERYNWKLLGKKEMYIPYNAFRMAFAGKLEDLKPNHVDPAALRWELHRVWVVEANLKPGKRHIYQKRRFYVDEDTWGIAATESYDALGNIFKIGFALTTPLQDTGGSLTWATCSYDMIRGIYAMSTWMPNMRWRNRDKRLPDSFYSPDSLSAKGVR